jgi:CheY-like chemotaxis protein
MTADYVLIIEDNKELADGLKTILAKSGRVMDIADSAEEALAKLGQRHYSLVLLDISLETDGEDVQGLELLDQIRKLEHPPQVIGITSYRNLRTPEGTLVGVAAKSKGVFSFIYRDKSLRDYMPRLKDDVDIAIDLAHVTG